MSEPRVGHSVWVEGVKPQPNGKIVFIDWKGDREVIVRFYDSGHQVSYEWEDFTDYNERLSQWQLRGI